MKINLVILAALLALFTITVTATPSDLQCRLSSSYYPEAYLRLLWKGEEMYIGRTDAKGVIYKVINDTFLEPQGEVFGEFVRSYSHILSTFVSKFYVLYQGAEFLAATIYQVPLKPDEFTRLDESCSVYEPTDLAPQFSRTIPVADNFFTVAYYYNDFGNPLFGLIEGFEFFFGKPLAKNVPGLTSVNYLFRFKPDEASVDTLTVYKFTKTSNDPEKCSEEQNKRRSVIEIPKEDLVVNLGNKFRLPIDVIYPQFRHLYL